MRTGEVWAPLSLECSQQVNVVSLASVFSVCIFHQVLLLHRTPFLLLHRSVMDSKTLASRAGRHLTVLRTLDASWANTAMGTHRCCPVVDVDLVSERWLSIEF